MALCHFAVHKPRVRWPQLILILWLGASSVACTYQHSRDSAMKMLQKTRLVSRHQVGRSGDWVLASGAPVCFTPAPLPQLTPLLDAALRRHFVAVHELVAADTEAETLQAARQSGCLALLVPQAPKLDREAETSAGRFALELVLYEVASGRLLDRGRAEATAGTVTPVAALPQDLLKRAVEAYVSRISNGALNG